MYCITGCYERLRVTEEEMESVLSIWGCNVFFHATEDLQKTELDLRNEYYFSSPPPDITDEEKRAGIFKIIMSDMVEKYSETYLLRDPYADLPSLYELFWEPPRPQEDPPPCPYSYTS
tara:strand:+ start:4310 stop:4663 length:354 start_codon:yes stop_codon:yes gene_type:complete